jgi:hypothetical protein
MSFLFILFTLQTFALRKHHECMVWPVRFKFCLSEVYWVGSICILSNEVLSNEEEDMTNLMRK